jgi:hypothetical protein
LGAVRHHDVDFVVIRVDAGFHGGAFAQSGVARPIPTGHAKGGDIASVGRQGKVRALPAGQRMRYDAVMIAVADGSLPVRAPA